MNWLIYVFGSGIAFFIGIALLVLAVAGAHAKSNTIVRISLVVLILGLALLVLSATPLPFWLWYLLGGSFINWTICSLFKRYAKPASIVLLAICSLAVVFEIQWHFKPRVTIASSKKLTVVGDSVTAGTGNNDKTIKWPDQLSRDFSILIDNRSVPGAKCSTALKQLQSAPVTSSVVLLEIGGNDLLGSTSDKKYRQDLERLSTVCMQFKSPDLYARITTSAPTKPVWDDSTRIGQQIQCRTDSETGFCRRSDWPGFDNRLGPFDSNGSRPDG